MVQSYYSNILSSPDYRPIACASIISKMLEHLILLKIKPLLNTDVNQFGFKQSHSTDQCLFLNKMFAPKSIITLHVCSLPKYLQSF